MSKIVLHIGTHKTASTTIQDTFAHNRRLLARHGIIFPAIGKTTGQHALAAEWIRMPPDFRLPEGPDGAWEHLIRSHAGGNRTVVLSSEEFSRARPQRVDMAELRDRLRPFDRVEVICFLRAQASFLQSIYMEVSRKRTSKPPPALVQEAIETCQSDGLWLDYGRLYDHLLQGFDASEIRFVPFGRSDTQSGSPNGAVIEPVLSRLGSRLQAADLHSLPHGRSNVSPQPLACWSANMVAAPKPAPPALIAAAERALSEQFGPAVRTSLFTREEQTQITAAFAPRNRALEARLAERQPGFRVVPDTRAAPLTHRGNINGQFWLKLAREMHREPTA